jgi:UDP-glucuronate decarboxylase
MVVRKRALVLGGAGFLGNYLCNSLINREYRVYCLDNLSTGSLDNLQDLATNSSFQLIEQDVRSKFNIEVDVIFNLACPASPPSYQLNPVGTMLTNFQGTLNGLKLARELNVPFIQASTSEIYGDPEQHPQSEGYWGNVNPVGKRSCYDEGKRAAETLCSDFRSQYRVSSRIVRIFNTYGPRMSRTDGRVISNFVNQALENKDITIYGDGSQTRSLCYVEDLIEGILSVGLGEVDVLGPVNLGNPQEITIQELASEIIVLCNSSSKIVNLPLPEDDPRRRKPDIALAKSLYDWSPKTSLTEGLIRTINYFRG